MKRRARGGRRIDSPRRGAPLAGPRGELVVAANVGQEPGDVIAIADAELGMRPFPYAFPLACPTAGPPTKFRVAALRLRFVRGGDRPRYDTTLTLTEV